MESVNKLKPDHEHRILFALAIIIIIFKLTSCGYYITSPSVVTGVHLVPDGYQHELLYMNNKGKEKVGYKTFPEQLMIGDSVYYHEEFRFVSNQKILE